MIEIVPTTQAHARLLIRHLREEDRAEIVAAGCRPAPAVVSAVRHSIFARAAFVDGDIAAAWGVGGMVLSGVGIPWLLTASPCERVSALRFAGIYRAEVAEMLRIFPMLESYVAATYTRSVRMLILAGFQLDEPKPYGPQGAMFRRFEMRAA